MAGLLETQIRLAGPDAADRVAEQRRRLEIARFRGCAHPALKVFDHLHRNAGFRPGVASPPRSPIAAALVR